jgi:putative redox protein
MPNAKVVYRGNMVFEGISGSGHSVVMDSAPEAGGENQGIRPMETVLVGLGGCTGMDVVSILQKMRVSFEAFDMEILGKRAETHPKVYELITLRYRFSGRRDDAEKIIRAVSLSQEKYCSVSAMLAKSAHIEAEIYLNGDLILTLNQPVG